MMPLTAFSVAVPSSVVPFESYGDVPARDYGLVDIRGTQVAFGDAWPRTSTAPHLRSMSRSTDFTGVLHLPPPDLDYSLFEAGVPTRAHNLHREAILARIDDLRADAAGEDEAFDEQSAGHLSAFCDALAPAVRPSIFRLQPGTLRAVWRDGDRQIGLQFLTDGNVQYVLLRPGRRGLLTTVGVDSPRVVRQIVGLLGLNHLWFRG